MLAWLIPLQCGLYVFGQFDHRRGGHLILYELGVILEVQAGDIVLLPSAAITHANVALASTDETRGSIVAFSAGRLFASEEFGDCTLGQLSADERARYDDEGEDRFLESIASFFPVV